MEEMAREALAGGPDTAKAAGWAQAWQDFRQRRAEMEVLNLDKGAFLVSAFSDMEQVMRKEAYATLPSVLKRPHPKIDMTETAAKTAFHHFNRDFLSERGAAYRARL